MADKKSIQQKAEKQGISLDGQGGYERYLLVCVGSGCCSSSDSRHLFKYVGKRLKELKKAGRFLRWSNVDCLMLCKGGPLIVVYPEGTWYHSVTPEIFDRIVEEHLLGGNPIHELAFAHNPLLPPGKVEDA